MSRKEEVRKGIAGYAHEQEVIKRLLRKRGKFTQHEFDKWLVGREWRRPLLRGPGITGDSFILGIGINGGNEWARYLDLMQYMMIVGLVDAKTINGVVTYFGAEA